MSSFKVIKKIVDLTPNYGSYVFPIGGIIPWMSPVAGSPAVLLSQLATGWQLCDGSLIVSGPLSGIYTPDLNSGKFIRGHDSSSAYGSSTALTTGGATSHAHSSAGSHTHTSPAQGMNSVTIQTGTEQLITGQPSGPGVNHGVGGDRHYHHGNPSSHSHTTYGGTTGADGSHSHSAEGNEPPFIDLLYIIRIV